MTIAVCIKCGAKKFGAFSTCVRCGVNPASSQDLAHSMIFSSHNYTNAELDEISDEIASTGELPISVERKENGLIAVIEQSPYFNVISKKTLVKQQLNSILDDLKTESTIFQTIEICISKMINACKRIKGHQ